MGSNTDSYQIIEDADSLHDVIEAACKEREYAIDTEFHRERTYYPHLALIQLAWADELVLIDPLAVDVAPLKKLLNGDGLAVLHASMQDLEVLDLATGTVPSRLFDTQVAAAFIGLRTPSLASLHDYFLAMKLPKANRLSDWLARPLDIDQQRYAASDVEHLLEIARMLRERLEDNGRLAWAESECELLRGRDLSRRDPQDAWLRIKEARNLNGRARACAQVLAAWRESVAQERDLPVRHVLPDLAVVALAQRVPKSVDQVGKVRGLERRGISGADAAEVIKVLASAEEVEVPTRAPRPSKNGPDLRPAVTLIAAWVNQFAQDNTIDPAMIGARADIEEFVRNPDEGKLSDGWRKSLVGDAILDLLEGNAALAFDGSGSVVVEQRSFQPLLSESV